MSNTAELEKMVYADLERHRQALADYLKIDPKDITVCPARINDIPTFQTERILYLVGTEEEVEAGIRGYFEHNLRELDTAFISQHAGLSSADAQMLGRLCEVLYEETATDILNDALLGVVKRCGDLRRLIDAAAAEVNRGEFLAMDGREIAFGEYLIYRFQEGQCSDLNY
ncbi:MAG: hypothetical protein QUS08_05365 [Methanothrix sp.]|nr:hypothetical protein [Methanothrix sp.]